MGKGTIQVDNTHRPQVKNLAPLTTQLDSKWLTCSTPTTLASGRKPQRSMVTSKQCVSGTRSNVLVKVISIPSPLLCRLLSNSRRLGGWWPDREGVQFPKDINEQIDQAFKNVDLTIKTAGGKGWSQVYRVNSYHLPLNDEALQAMARNFKKWMPDHQPIWTAVGVTRLGMDDMRVEIEVAAHVPSE